jgi:ABC-type Fe3+-hydroxamate transport system substrate-binding protein
LRDEVIGITKFCIHPDEWFRSKTRIGGTKNLNIEKIRSLNPDLIIANKEENELKQVSELMDDFPVWVSDIHNLDEAVSMIENISILINKKLDGERLIGGIKKEFTNLPVYNKKIKTAYLIWKNPLMTIGGDTFISEILSHVGFENAFDSQKRYPVISIGDIREIQPEIILLSSEPYPFKENHLEFFRQELPAVKPFL